MPTDAPFRRQIYQRSTRLTIKCVIKPNMHLNVLHAEVFIYILRVMCSLVWFSVHHHSTGCQCLNMHVQLQRHMTLDI